MAYTLPIPLQGNSQSFRCKVIACATVIEEMRLFLPEEIPYEVLDFGLHLNPQNLKRVLQEKVNQESQNADILLLGYGLCSMAIVGLHATTATLVIPRTDDCIAILLGSNEAYVEQTRKEPGTYYLTKGWIEVGDTPFSEYPYMVEKYGQEKADYIMGVLLKHYTRLVFINTGLDNIEKYRMYGRQTAEKFGLQYQEIEGSSELVKKLVFGPWDNDFMVVSPGETVTYQGFLDKNSGRTDPAPLMSQ